MWQNILKVGGVVTDRDSDLKQAIVVASSWTLPKRCSSAWGDDGVKGECQFNNLIPATDVFVIMISCDFCTVSFSTHLEEAFKF